MLTTDDGHGVVLQQYQPMLRYPPYMLKIILAAMLVNRQKLTAREPLDTSDVAKRAMNEAGCMERGRMDEKRRNRAK